MVFAGITLANAVLHQARKAGQHADGRVDALLVQIAVQHNLPLGDIARQVGDGVGDIIVRHGENGNLRYAAAAPGNDTRALVQAGKVGIQVPGVALAPRNFALGRGKFAQRLGIAGHIRHHHKDMHAFFERQIFRCCQRAARGENALDDGVGREVQKHRHTA